MVVLTRQSGGPLLTRQSGGPLLTRQSGGPQQTEWWSSADRVVVLIKQAGLEGGPGSVGA